MNVQHFAYTQECQNIIKIWSNPSIDPPNLFITEPKYGGVRCYDFVKALAKARYENNNIRRSFNKCFLVRKYPNEDNIQELIRFFESPRLTAEHHNQFIGVFCVNLSDYIPYTPSSAFQKLIDYVSTNTKYVKFIFVVSTNDTAAANHLYSILKKHIRINSVTLEYEDTITYTEFVHKVLEDKGITLDAEVKKTVFNYVDEMTTKKYFAGYDTILRFVDGIIYELQSTNINSLTGIDLINMKESLIDDTEDLNFKRIGF